MTSSSGRESDFTRCCRRNPLPDAVAGAVAACAGAAAGADAADGVGSAVASWVRCRFVEGLGALPSSTASPCLGEPTPPWDGPAAPLGTGTTLTCMWSKGCDVALTATAI